MADTADGPAGGLSRWGARARGSSGVGERAAFRVEGDPRVWTVDSSRTDACCVAPMWSLLWARGLGVAGSGDEGGSDDVALGPGVLEEAADVGGVGLGRKRVMFSHLSRELRDLRVYSSQLRVSTHSFGREIISR